jgi:hypothetical protein
MCFQHSPPHVPPLGLGRGTAAVYFLESSAYGCAFMSARPSRGAARAEGCRPYISLLHNYGSMAKRPCPWKRELFGRGDPTHLLRLSHEAISSLPRTRPRSEVQRRLDAIRGTCPTCADLPPTSSLSAILRMSDLIRAASCSCLAALQIPSIVITVALAPGSACRDSSPGAPAFPAPF